MQVDKLVMTKTKKTIIANPDLSGEAIYNLGLNAFNRIFVERVRGVPQDDSIFCSPFKGRSSALVESAKPAA
jgi:hypothetical protein